MGLKKAAVQGAKEFAKGKAKDFITGKGRKKKKGKGGGTGDGEGGDITLRTGSTAIVPTTPIIPGALANPEDVEYKESDRDKSVTLDSIANQLRSIVALTETLEKIVKKQYKGKKKATEKARVAKDKKKKQEREEKQENRILGAASVVGRKVSNQFNLMNFFTQMLLGTLAVFLVKNIDKIIAAFKFVQENLSLVLKSIYSFVKGFELLKPKFLKTIKTGNQAISNFAKPIKNAFSSVGSGIKKLFKAIGDLIPKIVKGALKAARNAAKVAASVPGRAVRSAGRAIRSAGRALSFLNPFRAQQGARATKSVIQRFTQRYGRGAAESKFGKKKVVGAVGKGFIGRKTDVAGKFVKKGARKVSVKATRGVQSIAKKFGMGAKFAKKLRIPVIGPLITAVASLLSGEPIQQALFKASGATLGGILGTLIPIPVVGTLIGELIGEYAGDLMYTLFMGGGIGALGKRLMKDITNVMSMGSTAIKWAGDGMKRFYEGIPKWKIPDWVPGWALGPVEGLLSLGGKSLKDIEIPSPLWMINPVNIGDKVGTFYKAFFTRDPMTEAKVSDPKKKPDEDGETTSQQSQQQSQQQTSTQPTTPKPDRSDYPQGRTGAAKYQKDMKEWQSSQPTVTTQQQTTPIQPQTPVVDGVTQTPGVSRPPTDVGDGAFNTGLKTGKSQYIGGSSDYHIDTKIKSDLSMEKKIAMMDQLASGYLAQGRNIEFSNAGVKNEIYDPNASFEEKADLLQRAFEAHNLPRGRDIDQGGFNSIDYYAPLIEDSQSTGGAGRFGKSVEGQEILIPTMGGTEVEYHQDGGYGAFVALTDENDEVLLKTGHGDIRGARSGQVQLSDSQDQMVGAPQQPQQQVQPQQQAVPRPKSMSKPVKPKREDYEFVKGGRHKYDQAMKTYYEDMKKYEESEVVEEPSLSPSPSPSPTPSPSPSPSAPINVDPASFSTANNDPSTWSSVNPQQNMLQPSDMILDASKPGFGMISPPSSGIERQASYDQPSEGGTTVLTPQPQQSPSQGGSSGGGSSPVMGASTAEVLNSYYKRQLLGFLYKQG